MVGSTISAMPRTAKDRDCVSPLCVDESLGNSSAATPRVDNGEEEEADFGFQQSSSVHCSVTFTWMIRIRGTFKL